MEVFCYKSCRRWTIGNFVSDIGVFVVKDECHRNQQTLLPCTIIEEKCDEFEGHLACLTQSEESLIKKSFLKQRGEVLTASWSPGSWQRRQAPTVRNRECFRKKRVLIFERLPSDN